jgi:toxin HigB-1
MALMIRGFHDAETERLFRRDSRSKLLRTLQRVALRKLLVLRAAETLNDFRVPPGN